MYVYNYDPDTGAYLGGTPADFDQQAPGEVLVPAYATTKPAPVGSLEREGFWPFFNTEAGEWEERELPKREPEPEAEAKPAETIDDLQESINAHLRAAQMMMDMLKARA